MDNYVCTKEKTPSIAHVYWMSDSCIAIPMCIYRFFVCIYTCMLPRQLDCWDNTLALGCSVGILSIVHEGGGGLSVDEGEGTDVYDYYSYYSIKNNHTHYN